MSEWQYLLVELHLHFSNSGGAKSKTRYRLNGLGIEFPWG